MQLLQDRPQLAAEVTGVRPSAIGLPPSASDVVARFRRAPIGDATVCVQVTAREIARNGVTVCKPVPPNAAVVVIDL